MKLFKLFEDENSVATQSPPLTPRDQQGLLLTGGGARAAYQVGVLKAIATLLPRNQSVPFPVICGTSAGAINATSLACFASCFHLGIRKLDHVWRNFHTEQVYEASFKRSLGHIVSRYMKGKSDDDATSVGGSILNNTPLDNLLTRLLDYDRIATNIQRGKLRAISVSASCYSTHQSINFFQAHPSVEPWSRAKREGRPANLNTQHLLASSAIPFIFPSRQLNNDFYCDGSINQLSPLSAPIHLGASKVLVIGVDPHDKQQGKPLHQAPDNSAIISHLLDTVFGDTLQSDLERVQRINHTINQITPEQRQKLGLKPIDCLVISPSVDINAIAPDYYYELPMAIRLLLRTLGVSQHSNTSILSYLMFEAAYCQKLIELGYQDGLEKTQELREFLHL